MLSPRSSYHLVNHCNTVYNQYTLNTMSEIDAKTVLKAVWADQKKTNVFLKKVFSFAPKDSTAIDAEQLVKKLDKNGLASLVIDAVVRLTESMDVTQRTTVQIDLCKDEIIMSQKKIDKLQSKLIENQELSTQKLLESAESLAKVSDVVKAEVNEVVTERKKTYAELLAKQESVELEVPKKAVEKNILKQALAESKQEDERLRSVIVSGLSDRMGPDEIRGDLNNILETIDMRESQVLSANYVGKKYTTKSSGTCCLVKVTFSTISGARQCIRQSKDLKGDQDWGDIYINPDRSPTERKEIKKLVAEMKTKIACDPSVFWKISKMKLVSVEKSDK